MRTNSIHKEIKMNLARSGMTLTEVVSRMNKNRSEENQTTIQNISNKIMRGTINVFRNLGDSCHTKHEYCMDREK